MAMRRPGPHSPQARVRAVRRQHVRQRQDGPRLWYHLTLSRYREIAASRAVVASAKKNAQRTSGRGGKLFVKDHDDCGTAK